jgi:hypothetical protein
MALTGTLTKDGRLIPAAARAFWIVGLLVVCATPDTWRFV